MARSGHKTMPHDPLRPNDVVLSANHFSGSENFLLQSQRNGAIICLKYIFPKKLNIRGLTGSEAPPLARPSRDRILENPGVGEKAVAFA